jgi:hypothetical protein
MNLRKMYIRDRMLQLLVSGKSDHEVRNDVMSEYKLSGRQVDRHMVKLVEELERKGDAGLGKYRQILLDRYNEQYMECGGIEELRSRIKMKKEITDSIARLCNLDKVVGSYTVNILQLIPDRPTLETLKGFGVQIQEAEWKATG